MNSNNLEDLKNRILDLEHLLNETRKEVAAIKKHNSTVGEIGNKYGRLTVVSLSSIKKSRKYFNCLCDCGKNVIVEMSQLRIGRTRSCGCLRAINVRNTIETNRTAKRREKGIGEFYV